MGLTRLLAIGIVLTGSLSAAAASNAPAAERASDRGFTLDEYSVIASRASGVWQVGAGLALGNSYRGQFHLFAGARVSWLQASNSGEASNGWALGAIGGVGFRPGEKWSPVATLAVDKLFGMDAFDSRLTASTGIRVRTGPRLDRHTSVSFLIFGSTLYGSGPAGDKSGYGLAVAYSLAFYE